MSIRLYRAWAVEHARAWGWTASISRSLRWASGFWRWPASRAHSRQTDTDRLGDLGKDDRALMVEPHVTNGRVKIAQIRLRQADGCFTARCLNHLLSQTTGFRIFDKQAAKRADDLVDCLVYATLRCLGDGRAGRWDKLKKRAA